MDTQVILILTSIDVHYSQKATFSFKKFSNGQNYSSSGSHHLAKKIPLSKIPLAGDFPLTHYCYLENPTMCKVKLLW